MMVFSISVCQIFRHHESFLTVQATGGRRICELSPSQDFNLLGDLGVYIPKLGMGLLYMWVPIHLGSARQGLFGTHDGGT